MVALGFVAGVWTASRRAPLTGILPDSVADLAVWLIIGAILGARILYVITFWREQFAGAPPWEWFAVWRGGLIYYGGFAGATLATIIWTRARRVGLWNLADVLAPSIPLGSVAGRIGCLLNGCCYGKVTALPWAIHFPQGHQTFPNGVHPTQIYDALANAAFYAALAWVYRRKRFNGQVFAQCLIGYGVLRFAVEFFRGDYPPAQLYFGGWGTPAQLASIAVCIAGAALYLLLPRPAPGGPVAMAKAAESAEPAGHPH